jgi:hypothetical protein
VACRALATSLFLSCRCAPGQPLANDFEGCIASVSVNKLSYFGNKFLARMRVCDWLIHDFLPVDSN